MVCLKCSRSDDSFTRSLPCNAGDHEWADEPRIVVKKAIDVLPKLHGIWCSIGDGKPFVNTIVLRSWSESKDDEIHFMLDSFNFYFAKQDDEMRVVELQPSQYDDVHKIHAEDAKFRAKRPMTDTEHARLFAT